MGSVILIPREWEPNLTKGFATLEIDDEPERLVKSQERVRDLGEVFTPMATVQAMLDLIPEEMWRPHPSTTFLEPSCGDGNFLVAILARKLTNVYQAFHDGNLAGGDSLKAVHFHALETLSSIYAIDISPENVIGGTPGHEIGALERMITVLMDWQKQCFEDHFDEVGPFIDSAKWIIYNNVQVGNMLPFEADGSPSGRDSLLILEYRWNPASLSVEVFQTTLGAVIEEAEADSGAVTSLFGPPQPRPLWSGDPFMLHAAQSPSAHTKSKRAKPAKQWSQK